MLLRNTCAATLTLSEICLIEDARNGDASSPRSSWSSPSAPSSPPATPPPCASPTTTWTPTPIATSMAKARSRPRHPGHPVHRRGHPTRVIPVCGRIVPAGEEAAPTDCPAPFTIPAGEAIADLCTR
ncbi:MAG: hypothetical protein R3F60_22700 [bacterium]